MHLCDINENKNGTLPLHYASLNGHLATVKYLTIEHKCDPLSKNKDSNTPLHLAALNGRLAIVKYFIEDSHTGIHSGEECIHLKTGVSHPLYF